MTKKSLYGLRKALGAMKSDQHQGAILKRGWLHRLIISSQDLEVRETKIIRKFVSKWAKADPKDQYDFTNFDKIWPLMALE